MISGFMFRPLKPTKVKVDNDNNANFEKNNKEAVDKLSNLLKTQPDLGTSSTPHTWMGVAPNTTYPTAIEVFRKSQTNLEMRRSSASATVLKNQLQTNGHNKPPKFIAVTVTEKEEDGNEASTAQPLLNEENGDGERRHTMSGRNPRSRRGTLTEESQVVRPLYREDIFFAGSLKKIPQYNSRTSVGYHMSVTHLPTVQDVAEETDATCTLCPEAVTRTLATMLDFSLLKSPSFLLLAFSGFFSMLGFFVPIIYAPARAITSGMNENNAMWIVSIIGIANTVGRVLCGLCSSFDGIDALWINNVAITLGGIATMFSGISSSMAFTYTYCVIFGISIGNLTFSTIYYITPTDIQISN